MVEKRESFGERLKRIRLEIESLPPLTADVARGLADVAVGSIEQSCARHPCKKPSPATKKALLKRVSRKTALELTTIDKFGVVVFDEICQITDRILAYRYVAQYRKVFRSQSDELFDAWQIHSQSLRTGELYIVQDRTSQLLKFLALVGQDCGLAVEDQSGSFSKKFKKDFEKRLRERHRIVHAHERLSYESRIMAFAGKTLSLPSETVAKFMLDTFSTSFSAMSEKLREEDCEAPSIEEVEKLHEMTDEREARQMMNLVGEYILKAVGKVK